MLICFAYSGRSSTRAWEIHRDASDGPCYPQLAEHTSETFYRFFAGRLVGVPSSSAVPAGHPISSESAADWAFPEGEPDGSWIALKYDLQRSTLSIAADIFNVQRWFYYQHGGSWYVANSLRCLHRIAPGLEIEWRAVPYLLHHGYLPRRLTPLKNVYELDAGEVLTVEHGVGTITRRAHLPVQRRPVFTEANPAERVANTIADAVRAEVSGVNELVVPISGGMDSRFLLGCALQALPPESITSLTFGLPTSLDLKIGTALARKLGVKNIALPMDERPIGEILRDNFATAEGMYWTVPDYSVKPFREALPVGSLLLSGYIGDPVFGSKEGKAPLEPVAGREEEMLGLLRKAGDVVPWTEVLPLLSEPTRDPLQLEDELRALPGQLMQERFDFWYFGTHTTNRTHYAVTPARRQAFFLMPFIHRRVLDTAFALPAEERLGQRAYRQAMKLRFPELYRFPTKRNYGFPIDQSGGIDMLAARSWRKLWSTVDDVLGPLLGRTIYRHPKFNYDHPRALHDRRHRADVSAALENLEHLPVFNPAAVRSFHDAYRKGVFDNGLLRGLLTVHQWVVQFGDKP